MKPEYMNIWQFQALVSRRLLVTNLINVLFGILLLRSRAFWRAVGEQAVGWGLVNIAIALIGGWSGSRRAAKDDAFSMSVLAKEARGLRRLLWINAGLDVVYMLGGWLWARRGAAAQDRRRGMGWGIVFQGALLFIFDVVHALRVPEYDTE